jgi:pimeloyl-ACP methyl ester carboxylesterase
MTTFVLVHGAWHGGWCWGRVRPALEAAGATVLTPTLTGLGERAHLLSKDVSLETHIEDVVGVLECECLADVVLVGHSYAGMVVTGVAHRAPERVGRVAYLDAIVPHDGQCLFDRTSPEFRRHIEETVATDGEGWMVPVPAPHGLGLSDDDDIRWTMPRLVPHPFRTFRDPVSLGRAAMPPVPRSYINCIGSQGHGGPRSSQAEGIEDYHELATGHDAMVTAPAQVAAVLLGIAGVPARAA